ncbi:hypothetical protein SAMN04488063_2911 [Halopelagius inordinatus]|uniref:DUF8142 domain-containing protein n=1 Tax=Halopelagius inordinatus TaxID=553467 RepID=A0A1I2UL03_9EURY|nr:hypothetical protein [Halopelagius inordinatus]SFG77844.1 hypothetical protein SAMN04488063_2911 [Halopelagius inordinatus]
MAASATSPDDESETDEFEEPLQPETGGKNRRRAVLAVLPFLAIGLGNVVLIVGMGTEPLWGFAILPPVLFCSVLAYIVFSTDFLDDRT